MIRHDIGSVFVPSYRVLVVSAIMAFIGLNIGFLSQPQEDCHNSSEIMRLPIISRHLPNDTASINHFSSPTSSVDLSKRKELVELNNHGEFACDLLSDSFRSLWSPKMCYEYQSTEPDETKKLYSKHVEYAKQKYLFTYDKELYQFPVSVVIHAFSSKFDNYLVSNSLKTVPYVIGLAHTPDNLSSFSDFTSLCDTIDLSIVPENSCILISESMQDISPTHILNNLLPLPSITKKIEEYPPLPSESDTIYQEELIINWQNSIKDLQSSLQFIKANYVPRLNKKTYPRNLFLTLSSLREVHELIKMILRHNKPVSLTPRDDSSIFGSIEQDSGTFSHIVGSLFDCYWVVFTTRKTEALVKKRFENDAGYLGNVLFVTNDWLDGLLGDLKEVNGKDDQLTVSKENLIKLWFAKMAVNVVAISELSTTYLWADPGFIVRSDVMDFFKGSVRLVSPIITEKLIKSQSNDKKIDSLAKFISSVALNNLINDATVTDYASTFQVPKSALLVVTSISEGQFPVFVSETTISSSIMFVKPTENVLNIFLEVIQNFDLVIAWNSLDTVFTKQLQHNQAKYLTEVYQVPNIFTKTVDDRGLESLLAHEEMRRFFLGETLSSAQQAGDVNDKFGSCFPYPLALSSEIFNHLHLKL